MMESIASESTAPLYISHLRQKFASLPPRDRDTITAVLRLIDGGNREFVITLPRIESVDAGDMEFLTDYVRAEVYNVLINLGGIEMTFYIDLSAGPLSTLLENSLSAFDVDKPLAERRGYGIAINVIDRMLRSLLRGAPRFRFGIRDKSDMPATTEARRESRVRRQADIFADVSRSLGGKCICGVDIGGSDIKAALAVDGRLAGLKEYDWFPEKYATAEEIIDPILLMVRLLRAQASLDRASQIDGGKRALLLGEQETVFDKDAPYGAMLGWVEKVEAGLADAGLIALDAVGLCFPDVVVRDKVVGGEVTKTRGMRENRNLDYETEFAKLTDLDERLLEICKPGAVVKNTNDGPMAAFTAAVELAAGDKPEVVRRGIFAHTLGTELGTGWVTSEGAIPEIPLETYNLVLDLGSMTEKAFPADDVRSVNNFNTGLRGSIQRYTSQSGVFRIALRRLAGCRDDLIREFYDRGFLAHTEIDGRPAVEVPVNPKDMRKAFLEHIMSLVESEQDECVKDIFRDVGRALGVAWHETQYILQPECSERVLFGRLVKRRECFRLLREGAKSLYPEIEFTVADEGLANTSLMRQLAAHRRYTVAQFAQAVGAIYYAHMGMLAREISALSR